MTDKAKNVNNDMMTLVRTIKISLKFNSLQAKMNGLVEIANKNIKKLCKR